jgi:hypothetical protein
MIAMRATYPKVRTTPDSFEWFRRFLIASSLVVVLITTRVNPAIAKKRNAP